MFFLARLQQSLYICIVKKKKRITIKNKNIMKTTKTNIQYFTEKNFYNENDDRTLMISSVKGEKVSFKIDSYDETTYGDATIDEIIEKIEREGWMLDDSDVREIEQEMEMDAMISEMPETTIEAQTYTCKNGYTMNVYFVNAENLDKREFSDAEYEVKELRGWYDRKQGGFILRSENDAQTIINKYYF